MPPKRKRARRQYGTGSLYQRRADGRWVGKLAAGWTPTGTRRYLYVTAKTEAEAKRRLEELRRQIARDGTPEAGTARTTIKAWSEVWLPMHAAKVRPKAYTTDAGVIARWVVPTIGHRRLADLTPGDVRNVHKAIAQAGRSRYVGRQAHWTLMGMLKAAILEGHPVPYRVLGVPSPATAISDRGAIPPDDVKRIFAVVEHRQDAVRWIAAFLQGMRQGEVLGLTWDAVDFTPRPKAPHGRLDVSWQLQTLPYVDHRDKARGFRVPDEFEARHLIDAFHLTRPKTQAGTRIVPLLPFVADALAAWRDEAPENPWGLVWSAWQGRPVPSRVDRAMWADVQRAAGVSRPDGTLYTLHEARHTAASLMLWAGVDAEVVKQIMGHSTVAMSRAYQHVGDELKTAALQAVVTRLGITTGETT